MVNRKRPTGRGKNEATKPTDYAPRFDGEIAEGYGPLTKPRGLSKPAAGIWDEVVERAPAGLFCEQDRALLRKYCEALAAADDFEPGDTSWKRCVDTAAKLANMLGIGPVGRAQGQRAEPAEDEFTRWQAEVFGWAGSRDRVE